MCGTGSWRYAGMIHDYPDCQDYGCADGGYQRKGTSYRIRGKCYKAVSGCMGCLGAILDVPTRSYPQHLVEFPCVNEWPACEASANGCITHHSNGWKYQKPGVIYRVNGMCYKATTGCTGCVGNPAAYPTAFTPVPCANDFPECVNGGSCVTKSGGHNYQRVGVIYRVEGRCYKATSACTGCLEAGPEKYLHALPAVDCPDLNIAGTQVGAAIGHAYSAAGPGLCEDEMCCGAARTLTRGALPRLPCTFPSVALLTPLHRVWPQVDRASRAAPTTPAPPRATRRTMRTRVSARARPRPSVRSSTISLRVARAA